MSSEQIYLNEIEELKKNLSVERFHHTVSVGETCVRLCDYFGVHCPEIYLTGILHDFAREKDLKELVELSLEKDFPQYPEEYNDIPVLLHAPAAVYFAISKFSPLPESCRRAIIYHPCGDPELNEVSLILLIADLIEPLRNFKRNRDLYERVFSCTDLYEAAELILRQKIEYSRLAGKNILKITKLTHENLLNRIKNKNR